MGALSFQPVIFIFRRKTQTELSTDHGHRNGQPLVSLYLILPVRAESTYADNCRPDAF